MRSNRVHEILRIQRRQNEPRNNVKHHTYIQSIHEYLQTHREKGMAWFTLCILIISVVLMHTNEVLESSLCE